jgi:bifunctional DNA-binding transcriptional regulator/antitoxin component of YhaV-PrlF toxin-antitoxin module
MKRLRISKGGQVSIPAEVRHRWDTNTVIADDQGDRLVLRPVPDDPIAAAKGIFAGMGMSSDEAHAQARREEEEIARRKYGAP